MSRGLAFSSIALSLILLAGCGTSGGGGGGGGFDPIATPVNAAMPSNDPAPVATGTLAAGETRFYEVTVSSTVAANSEVIYYEVDVGNDGEQNGANAVVLRLYSAGGSILASSRTHAWFGPGTDAELASAQDDVYDYSTKAVGLERPCFGPCIIEGSGFGTRYLRLQNVTGVTQSFALYAYGFDLQDTHEPSNDSSSNAVLLTDTDSGAIEQIDDVDYFEIATSGQLFFDSAASDELGLRLEILGSGGGVVADYPPGGASIPVFAGEVLRVRSTEGRAGSPDASVYYLDLN